MAKILCIEDEDLLRRDLTEELSDAGYEAYAANNGVDGLNLILKHRPDLVLCDIHMPEMDGWQLLEKLREIPGLLDSMTFIFLSAMGDKESVINGRDLGADDFISKPVDFEILLSTVRSHLHKAEKVTQLHTAEMNELQSLIRRVREQLDHKEIEIEGILFGLVEALSEAISVRDPYTSGHQRSVANIAVKIGRSVGMDEMALCGIQLGGMVHDIGKLAIPVELLVFSGELSEEQFAFIKTHPAAGHKIVSKVNFPWPIGDIVLQHHERLDGSGYPNGLSGNDILREAQIIALADVYDAISSDRPYRASRGKDYALKLIREVRGIHFDEGLTDAALDVLEKL